MLVDILGPSHLRSHPSVSLAVARFKFLLSKESILRLYCPLTRKEGKDQQACGTQDELDKITQMKERKLYIEFADPIQWSARVSQQARIPTSERGLYGWFLGTGQVPRMDSTLFVNGNYVQMAINKPNPMESDHLTTLILVTILHQFSHYLVHHLHGTLSANPWGIEPATESRETFEVVAFGGRFSHVQTKSEDNPFLVQATYLQRLVDKKCCLATPEFMDCLLHDSNPSFPIASTMLDKLFTQDTLKTKVDAAICPSTYPKTEDKDNIELVFFERPFGDKRC